jgi:hypothetical protein
MVNGRLNESNNVAIEGGYCRVTRVMARGAELLILCVAVLSFPERANADVISVGKLSFETFILGAANRFVVGNFTDTDAAPPDFPALTAASFVGAALVLSRPALPDENVPLGNLGPGQHFSNFYLISDVFTKAHFTATLSPLALALGGGATFIPSNANIDVDLVPSAGTELNTGDFVTIDLEGDVIQVASEPAPAVLLLVAAAAVTFAHRRRRFSA